MTDQKSKTPGPAGGLVTLLLITALAAPGAVHAAAPKTDMQMELTASFPPDALLFGESLGYDTVRFAEAGCLNRPGEPMVPIRTLRVALPAGMAVTGVRVLASESIELSGEYTLLPGRLPRHTSEAPAADDLPAKNRRIYSSPDPYPAELVSFLHQTDLAGQPIAVLQVRPLQYLPAEKRLVLHTTIQLALEGVDGYRCGDYLPRRASARTRQALEDMAAELVVNPQDVRLQASTARPEGPRGVGDGEYDYVIITQSAWVDEFQPLADWKTRKGTPATIVTTDWIYSAGGYGGSSVDKIQDFVIDARANWGTMYFLLGGDTNIIPFHEKWALGEPVPNDTHYADYDGDWTTEVHVGRASARTAGQVNTFVDKVLTYETDPPLTDYGQTAFFFGFDMTWSGSYEGEGTKKAIKSESLPAGWTLRTEYDSEYGSHKADTIGYLNQGNNLANHIDHCQTDEMGLGATVHGDYLYNEDMEGLTNGDRQTILYSIGCYPCDYPDDTCIAESFVRNPNGGGVAFVGNSRYGWYYPGTTDDYSLHLDRCFFRSLFNQGHYVLGDCFSDHKNDGYQGDDYYKYIYTELTLLGDPEMTIWTANPGGLSVTHAGTLSAGQYTDFVVEVEAGGSPVSGATVCVWLEDDLYAVKQTGSSGKATFGLAPAGEGTLLVTVVRHNSLPYLGSAEVVSGLPYILPHDYTIVRGQHLGGGLSDLFASDDSDLEVGVGFVLSDVEPPAWVVVEGTAGTAAPGEFTFVLEASANTAGLTQNIELYNFDTEAYELVDTRVAAGSDAVVQVALDGDLSRFVEPDTLEMKAQVTWKANGPITLFPWAVGIDQSVWIVAP